MKRGIAVLLTTVLLWCGGCAVVNKAGSEQAVRMDDLLKISTWVMDPALEGKGYWAFTDSASPGYWVADEGEEKVDDGDVFREERLQTGEVRIMAPIGYKGANLNFKIDFDGVVTAEKTDPDDNSILISFDPNLNDQWTGETTITANGPCTLNVYPVGKDLSSEGVGGALVQRSTVADEEYLLTIRGYTLDGTLMVTAVLKLTALEDEAYPYDEIQENRREGFGELFSANEKRTRFCSVELVSYEYSDQYRMMETGG